MGFVNLVLLAAKAALLPQCAILAMPNSHLLVMPVNLVQLIAKLVHLPQCVLLAALSSH